MKMLDKAKYVVFREFDHFELRNGVNDDSIYRSYTVKLRNVSNYCTLILF